MSIESQTPPPSKIGSWIDGWNPYSPEKLKGKGLKPVEIEESQIRKTAARLFLLFFLLFMIWANFAPIDAGVTVPGEVMVEGQRKQVQHPTGGVIEEILVKEGSTVKAGDVLGQLDDVEERSTLRELEARRARLESDVERTRGLVARAAATQTALDQLVTQLAEYEARMAAQEDRIADLVLRALLSRTFW